MTHGHFEGLFRINIFKVRFWDGGGVTKKSTLCTLVKMMTIMDDPLQHQLERTNLISFISVFVCVLGVVLQTCKKKTCTPTPQNVVFDKRKLWLSLSIIFTKPAQILHVKIVIIFPHRWCHYRLIYLCETWRLLDHHLSPICTFTTQFVMHCELDHLPIHE